MRNKSTSHDRPGVGFLAVLGGGEEERRLSKLQTVPFVFIIFKLKL